MAKQPDIKFLFDNPAHLLALGFGSGLAPKAPGTFGTAAALPFWLIIASMPAIYQLGFIVLGFAIGILLCESAARALGVHDHGSIVWDEFVGLWITLYLVPDGWLWIVLGFLFFRFFDIVKPWPIKVLDSKVGGGFGIMIDDVVAGVMAGLLLKWAAVLI
ncbi:MAG: phosphatidylglycerophosphatase A [Gammaproteobacteria bacterium]|nr:phosphatidylglycerophosphatase A [Gammaproteobacteria bacterium]MBT8151231.1 phosphatidylglycerophosphatase A [Gammaproteobacteria bacterium]NND39562.1 phosphatidylglycerophosphatase A [Pseudomonadales bacterium]NNM10804.1 phosphatidylglycerophosphatase A [Pseudomonadales bacterium]RZV58800.1 MAG: phosphatidylglycerophosphatase A [Pseudomonadales bacterium]